MNRLMGFGACTSNASRRPLLYTKSKHICTLQEIIWYKLFCMPFPILLMWTCVCSTYIFAPHITLFYVHKECTFLYCPVVCSWAILFSSPFSQFTVQPPQTPSDKNYYYAVSSFIKLTPICKIMMMMMAITILELKHNQRLQLFESAPLFVT